MSDSPSQPTPAGPAQFMEIATSYQRTAALKGAVELDVFTAVGEGNDTAAALARRCGASERGMRILCDYLVIMGLLQKTDGKYRPTPTSSMCLDRNSPAYMGGTLDFVLSPTITEGFRDVAAMVRKGGTVVESHGTVPENPLWVTFARAMGPLMKRPAELLAEFFDPEARQPLKILDISAGHGMYGISAAVRNPAARVTALDWPNVVQVARENAALAGIADRFDTIPGSAFDVDWKGPYDVILFPNFLHHFDRTGCERLLHKAKAALTPEGRVVVLDFIPDENRVWPPRDATFALQMLSSTPAGDAYTFNDYRQMFQTAGFSRVELHALPPVDRVVVARR